MAWIMLTTTDGRLTYVSTQNIEFFSEEYDLSTSQRWTKLTMRNRDWIEVKESLQDVVRKIQSIPQTEETITPAGAQ